MERGAIVVGPAEGLVYVRRLPVGAEWTGKGVDFRVWAPECSRVEVVLELGPGAVTSCACETEPGGYHRARAATASAGTLYRYRLDGEAALLPDPASRSQPSGPEGPSEVVDPGAFAWSDGAWTGVTSPRPVIYEIHVGTFTPEGTWRAATEELPALAGLGVTTIELMPVADFPGRFGWGYDGVSLFAPTRLYGRPDDLRRFVGRAHELGVGVVLDVVYNHLGPAGSSLRRFSDAYAHPHRSTEWGPAFNYDGPGSAGVRQFVLASARAWIEEYHLDGLRLDSTHAMLDSSAEHILLALARAAREAAPSRTICLAAEDEAPSSRLVRPPEQGGFGLDAVWSDDLHHAARVALTGQAEGYYKDYGGTPQELVSALKYGVLYQGQRSVARGGVARGEPVLDLPASRLVTYLENHDHVATSAGGRRLNAMNPSRHRALATLVLLGPSSVLLFQGEEFASTRPFFFFADHEPALAEKVEEGRRRVFATFPSVTGSVDVRALAPRPSDESTFLRCKLDFAERGRHAPTLAFYRDVLELRRSDAVFGGLPARPLDGAALTPRAFVVRFFGSAEDRLVLVNLGPDELLSRLPEPLLAPPRSRRWQPLFFSEDPRYGGRGTPPVEDDAGIRLQGEAAVVLQSVRVAPAGKP